MRILGLASLLCVVACSDDNGTPPPDKGNGGDIAVVDQGPTGDQGQPGDTGQPGDQGQPQPDGAQANCDAMDAKEEGMCDMVLGISWDGKMCTYLSGCSCVGNDCDKLFKSPGDCTTAYTTCICRPTDATAVGQCKMLLGWVWDGKQCKSLGGCSCSGADCTKLFQSEKECQQAHTGVTCP